MPRHYKWYRRRAKSAPPTYKLNRSSKRKEWADDQMVEAMDAVAQGGMSANQAAATYGVPPSTLKDRMSGRVKHGKKPGPSSLAGQPSSLSSPNSMGSPSATPSSGSRADGKASLVSKYCSLIPTPVRPRPKKTPRARVLTSDERLAMLEEREANKMEEALEKERRKEEREQKKIEREQKQEAAEKREQRKKDQAEKKQKKEEEARRKKEEAAKKKQGKSQSRARVTRGQKSSAGASKRDDQTSSPTHPSDQQVMRKEPTGPVAENSNGESSLSKKTSVSMRDDDSPSPCHGSESSTGRRGRIQQMLVPVGMLDLREQGTRKTVKWNLISAVCAFAHTRRMCLGVTGWSKYVQYTQAMDSDYECMYEEFNVFLERLCGLDDNWNFWHNFVFHDMLAYVGLYLGIRGGCGTFVWLV